MANNKSVIHKGNPRYMGSHSNQFDCYIENKRIPAGSKGRRIPLIFSPNSISDGISASFNQENVPGSSAPVIAYNSTGARTVSIDFFVPIDYLPPNTDFNNTEEYLNALRALSTCSWCCSNLGTAFSSGLALRHPGIIFLRK